MSDIVINPPRRTPPVVVEADAPAQVTTTIGRGPQGEPGPGVPAGGTTGQVLAKTSGADYATGWVTVSGAGSVAWGDVTGTPTTLAGYGITDAATAVQGALADSASQPGHTHSIANVAGLQSALDGKQPLATVLTNTTASFTTAQETKLAGIAAGATANSPDATLLARANHTGTQLAATISDFAAAVAAAGGVTQVYVQNTDPGMTGPGIWIQTGLAPSGAGFTFWFEDGL